MTNDGGTNFTLTTSFATYTKTVTVPASTTQISLTFAVTPTGTAGTNDWFEVAEVQVERGSVATPFEHRSYGDELARCQRYFLHIHKAGTTGYGDGASQTARSMTTITFPVQMRDGPTFSDANATINTYRVSSTIGESATGLTAHYLSYTTTDAGSNYWQLTSGYFTYNAEL